MTSEIISKIDQLAELVKKVNDIVCELHDAGIAYNASAYVESITVGMYTGKLAELAEFRGADVSCNDASGGYSISKAFIDGIEYYEVDRNEKE